MLTLATAKKDKRVKAEFERLGALSRAHLLSESDKDLRALYGTASNARDHRLSAPEIWELTESGKLERLGEGSSAIAYSFNNKAVILRNNGYTRFGNQLFNRMCRYEKMISTENPYLKYFLPIYRAGMKAGDKMRGNEIDPRYIEESFLIVPYCEIYENKADLITAAEKRGIENPADKIDNLHYVLEKQIIDNEPAFHDFQIPNIGIYFNPYLCEYEIVVTDYGAIF